MKSLTRHGSSFLTATKAVILVAAVWGLIYPSLLWALERLLK
ncbi:MAG: hypothetical protein ABW005_11375 [Burkholderiaceae bacterium]